MSKPVAETGVTPAGETETPLQCILYYSNPNFINDQDSATIQFGNEEDDDDEEEEEDDDEEEEEEDDDYDNNDAIKTQGFDHHPQHHHHHRQHQQQQPIPGLLPGVDDHGSLEDQELDADASYADFYEQDTSESRATSIVESSIRSRQRQFSQQRLVGGVGGALRGPGPSIACLCRATVACLRTRPCLFFVYVLVVLVLLSSFVSVVLVAILVVEPFVRVSRFVNGTCRTLEVSVGREEQSCSCGKGCNSKYFCLKIQVEYFDAFAYAMFTATLYEDETSLNRQCSFYPPCRSSRQENEEAVHIYERLYGRPGLEFSCWYNPENNGSSHHLRRTATAAASALAKASGGGEVIQSKRFQAHHVAHGLTWSTLLLLGSFSFLFHMFRRKGCFH